MTKKSYEDITSYIQLYEEVAKKYNETEIVHGDQACPSRFWTINKILLPFAKNGSSLLDIGCNDGVYTIPYCLAGGQSLGIDIAPTIIKKAQRKANFLDRCEFMVIDIQKEGMREELKMNAGRKFDVVLFSEVLEHLLNPNQAMKNIYNLLKPQGYLVLTTPTPLYEKSQPFLKYLTKLFLNNKLLEHHLIDTTKNEILKQHNISPYVYRHDGYYPLALKKWVEKFGFSCKKQYTISFPAPNFLKAVYSFFSFKEKESFLDLKPKHSPQNSIFKLLKLVRIIYEFSLRRTPILKFFGGTNVCIFQKTTLPKR